jgi:uncharacterized protein (TIGR02453 family)
MTDFDGFPKATMTFLRKLAKNNNREWFQDNKASYESDWLEPSLAFIEAMKKPIERSFSPCFVAVPKRVGGSLMRIYRDTRFSKVKTPYKANIGIHFRHEFARDVHAPGLYVHLDPKELFWGVGIWRPDSTALRQIRARIDEEPDAWRKAKNGKAFRSEFELGGDSLKRPPTGYDAEHPWIEDLKRKDFIAAKKIDAAAISRPEFVRDTIATFKKAKPFVSFLCDAIGVPF